MTTATANLDFDKSYAEKYGFRDEEDYSFKEEKGISADVVRRISKMKDEPAWMTEVRLEAYEIFRQKPMPDWGNMRLLRDMDFEDIYYYIRATDRERRSWDDVPENIKNTFDKLGIPEAEQKFLAGVSAQYESEVVYHSIREDLERKGVIFLAMDQGLKDHPEIVRKHFGTVIPSADNKLAALNTAVWSGGSFIYIPPGVHVDIPLQAYFRINAENAGQFERTLIIADEGSSVHYIEGCTAPTYATNSLHSAVVELIALRGSRIRYTTIQNWSKNVFNLVTKRAVAHEDATVEWIDGNLGSRLTMKFPAIYLVGEGARGEILSVAMAGRGQHQDAGAKIVHVAPRTTSTIVARSISKDGGRTTYRGLAKIHKGATGARASVKCDALMLDPDSRSDTYPTIEVEEETAIVSHEATVSAIGDEEIFYLNTRGLDETEATTLIVNGFMEPFTKELPMEYAVELNRLIQLEMEGAIG